MSSPDASPVAVLTGGTSGLGRHVALGLLRAGRRVVLLARSAERGEQARAWLLSQAANADVEVEVADLSSLAETRAAGERIAARHPRLSLLLNNAGVFQSKPEQTAEGFDRVMAVNLLSPVVLTRALLPALIAGAPSRIVDVGSSASDRARLDPGGLVLGPRWTMIGAYSQSKLALMMSAFQLARRLDGAGVSVHVVHPGFVATGLVREGGAIGLSWSLLRRFALSEEKGADTPVYAALDPDLEGRTGLYLKRRRPAPPNPAALNAQQVGRTTAEIERLAGPWLAPYPPPAAR